MGSTRVVVELFVLIQIQTSAQQFNPNAIPSKPGRMLPDWQLFTDVLIPSGTVCLLLFRMTSLGQWFAAEMLSNGVSDSDQIASNSQSSPGSQTETVTN
jgi:hypothetical protein